MSKLPVTTRKQEDEDFEVELPWVSDRYLQTLGIPLVAGRYFSASDTSTATKVMIVNQSFARHYFGSPQNALGHHVSRPDRSETDSIIVGVVRDASTPRSAIPQGLPCIVSSFKPKNRRLSTSTYAPGSHRTRLQPASARPSTTSTASSS